MDIEPAAYRRWRQVAWRRYYSAMRGEAEALGKAVREVRERFGLSQEELAAFAGINRTSLGEIERGETNPGFDTLCRIAAAFNIPLSELIRTYEQQSRK